MTPRMKVVSFEKLIDLFVVIAGILIAISMNTCVENRAYKKDWDEHKILFVQSIEQTKADYQKNLEEVEKQVDLAKASLAELKESKTIDKDSSVKLFFNSLGSLHISAAVNEGLYRSFLNSKNPYFLKDFELMMAFDEMYSFKEGVVLMADSYISITIPELLKLIKKTRDSKFLNSKEGRDEAEFFIISQKGFLGGLAYQYKLQIENADKIIEKFKN